ncbi:MAG: SUMF1/EgtB/PvdO family nonheme iron enzyme [Gammaproteobacteria bacterium]|nr:SUMF1/EgtB/PvdO family nonheme iron enzyme [Gammaproteobacteria bacterium]
MKTLKQLRIVLSSPGDVEGERQVMQNVIDEVNHVVALDRGLHLELSRWETDAYPGFHAEGPQGLIDPVLKIEECDILLGIFWKRFGTPTTKAQSGTEHEIRAAISSWKKRKRPVIMMYFKEEPFYPKNEEEHNQHGLVIRFRSDFPKEGLYWTFKDVSEFENLARRHLSNFIREHYKLTGEEDDEGLEENGERVYVRDYCRQVRNRYSTMYLFGRQRRNVGDSGKALEHLASIEDGFVPLQLSDWREGDSRSGVVPMSIEELFIDDGKEFRFLVRGLPGSGKTTLMHYLAHRLANVDTKGRMDRIPVYVRLRDYCCAKKSLEEFVRQQINEESDSREMYDVLCDKARFLDQPMVVLLDGMDEIEDRETNKEITNILNEFAMDHPRCGVIVTSRPIGIVREDYPRYRLLNLLPLSNSMIDNYLKRWFAGDKEKIDSLKATFKDKPRIRTLAANPFILSMICFTFQEGGKTELIERRSQLYESCTNYLLERPYDIGKKSGHKSSRAQMLELLQELSLRFFLWQEADFDADHVNVIGRHHPTCDSLGQTDEVLNQLQQETGLIQRVKDAYTFVHRSLWEYFTALALMKGRKQEYVIRHAANPDWEEVVRLYAGLLDRDDEIRKLINGLWTINRPLALRVSTEIRAPISEIIKPLIEKEEGNEGKRLLINAIEQSLPLVGELERQDLVQETLSIMLLECRECDCEVIYSAQSLLEKMGLEPLKPGGVIFELLDLANARARQQEFLNDPANCFKWEHVEGGAFWMGDDGHGDNERPSHQVNVNCFFMAKHPVTNKMLAGFPFGDKYSQYGGENNPAVGNTWFEAYYFALWLDAQLPTEAQWEYAARGGKDGQRTKYYFGDKAEDLTRHAWFGEGDRPHAHAVDDVNPHTGRENLNPLGLANMHGNVYEWCADWYNSVYYGQSPDEDPEGPERGSRRVVRGGGWYRGAGYCRSAIRNYFVPGIRDYRLGFRLARSVALDT